MITDTHAHLDFPDFADDLDIVLQRAAEAGVHRIVTIGTSLQGSKRAIALAEHYSHVYAAVGIHPGNAAEAPDDFIDPLRKLARHEKVVALGECGLDHYRLPGKQTEPMAADDPRQHEAAERNRAHKEQQAVVFRAQLDLACELGLNVVVHERDAWADTVELLAPYTGKLRAVFHCFGKSPTHAEQLISAGHLVSFTGIVTFKNAGDAKEAAKAVPAGSFMVETDCPFLAPVPFRGKRCEPVHTRITAEFLANLRGVELETLARETEAVANEFFRFSR